MGLKWIEGLDFCTWSQKCLRYMNVFSFLTLRDRKCSSLCSLALMSTKTNSWSTYFSYTVVRTCIEAVKRGFTWTLIAAMMGEDGDMIKNKEEIEQAIYHRPHLIHLYIHIYWYLKFCFQIPIYTIFWNNSLYGYLEGRLVFLNSP